MARRPIESSAGGASREGESGLLGDLASSRQVAVALRYDPAREPAPRILAKGHGEAARAIADVARAHDVPVREEASVARVLSHLEPGTMVPPELFRAVAEVIAFVLRVDAREQQRRGATAPRRPGP